MKRGMLTFLWLLLFISAGAGLPPSYATSCAVGTLQIDTGHQGPICCLMYDSREDLLFSAGSDGTVRVWDEGVQHAAVRVSHLSVRMLALHPEQPRFAALEVLGPNRSRISVWDWSSAKMLYAIDLAEIPLFLSFSPNGSYLIYGIAEVQSMKFHDARNGKPMSRLNATLGLVSFAEISQNESNILTYQPSGRLTYWKLQTGAKIQEANTLTDLSLLSIPRDNKRYIVGKKADSIVVIDSLTGTVRDMEPVSGLVSLAVSPEGDRIAGLARENGTTVLHTWNFIGSNLYAGLSPRKWDAKSSQHPQTVFLTDDRTYLGAEDGSLSYSAAGGEPVEFSRNNLLEITSLEVAHNVVALGSDQGLVVYTLATNDRAYLPENLITDFSFGIYSNPFASAVGMELFSEREMLLWDMSENQQGIAFLDTWTGIREKVPTSSSSPYLQVDSLSYSLLTLEKNGRVKVIQEIGGETLFEYTSPGLKKVIALDETWLVGAGNRTTGYSGALVRINRSTRETVPISGSSLLAYDLAYDSARDTLYSLSIERTTEETMTVVKRHIGPDFENEQIILQYPGEDLAASLHYSPENRELYTSIGFGPVKIWNGWSVKVLEQSCHIPRVLRASGRLVFSLNQDSTISIWDRKSGKLLSDVYIFNDLSWVAVFPTEKAYLSEAAEDYLIFTGSRSRSLFRQPNPWGTFE